jgi:predicted GIY-YIG superfamily endonuclease
VNRAFNYCSNNNTLINELDFIRDILLKNDFPLSLINNIIKQTEMKFKNPNTDNKFDKNKVIAIPYVAGISEKIRLIFRKFDYNIVFKKGKNLKSFYNLNTNINKLDKVNVVYNIECNDCNAIYVGNTKRKLSTRLNEHKKAFQCDYIKSHIAEHAINCRHQILFENPKIAFTEKNYYSRKFLESWNIEKNKKFNIPLMNIQQTDESIIPKQYFPLI